MSKRDFSKVSPAIWRSKRFRALQNDRSRLLLFYYLTSQHQTSAGAYQLAEGYACADLGWSAEEYRAARSPLVESGLIFFDEETEEVFISGWFRTCPPMNEKHAVGCQKMIATIESDLVRGAVEREFAKAEQDQQEKLAVMRRGGMR